MCMGPLIKISGVSCQIVFVYIFAVIKTKSSFNSTSHRFIATSPPPAATITKYEKKLKKKNLVRYVRIKIYV